jgi:parvulin-like peptidyl-prolyl isomerase
MRLSLIFFVWISATANGQVVEEIKSDLSKIQTTQQAKEYLGKQSSIKGELFELNSGRDTTDMDKELIGENAGHLIDYESEDKKKHYFFKTLSVTQVRSFRVQYIFLDNKKITKEKVDSLKSVIFKRLDNGESFDILAREYSMDINSQKGGDLGWFSEGMMMREFEEKIKRKQTGEIFAVDIPSEKWYYIVRNSHSPRFDKKASVLYVEIDTLK